MDGWSEVGDGVFVGRYREWDLTVGLVLGDTGCLVVDTRADRAQGAELASAVRAVTPLPWTVLLTHHHFDHCLGLPAFLPCPVWAHERCAAHLRAPGGDAAVPDHPLTGHAAVDLGGRRVRLHHPGPAHTDNDVLAHVPDAGVVFAGDLVEHVPGGSFSAESFEDVTHLAQWPAALDALLALAPRVVVPGHGDPVGPDFVASARDELAALIHLRRERDSGALTTDEAVARAPLPPPVAGAALR
ncbi:MBL fold metallo-hydrolase [Saccharomonospora iraqiensis]|uniref:MBL fold metallo-hydrolase n=1 Tax=Saccharomonospora iraqiensis TaxID=52698 RepID=UPI00022E2490|nr:MBL fold metallo-hydrolase [Saccharomonospora iraqiensis]